MENSSEDAAAIQPLNGKETWFQDPEDPNLVRYWDGYAWHGSSMRIDYATLRTLHSMRQENSRMRFQLDRIRFRVGFLALVVLLEIIFGGLLILSAANNFSTLTG